MVQVFARHLDTDIHVAHQIPLDGDLSSTVHVNAVGRILPPIGGIIEGGNVVNDVAAYLAVARLIVSRIGRYSLESDRVDPNVVVVVDEIVDDAPILHVAIK